LIRRHQLRLAIALSIACRCQLPGEVVDRIAAVVNRDVIAMSEVVLQARLAALIDEKPLRLDAETLRESADRLVDQALVRREIALGSYEVDGADGASRLLESLKARLTQPLPELLIRYRVTEAELVEHLAWILTLTRFIDLRFRPGIQISPIDLQEYYQAHFLPAWKRERATAPPDFETVRERLEAELIPERLNQATERWLNQGRAQVSLEIREDAIQETAAALGAQP
jgi:hypothetical protein